MSIELSASFDVFLRSYNEVQELSMSLISSLGRNAIDVIQVLAHLSIAIISFRRNRNNKTMREKIQKQVKKKKIT